MNAPFEIQAFDLNDIGRRGSGCINVLINGYWSADPISLYVQREFRWSTEAGESGSWKVNVSHSSGGRQTDPAKERCVASDMDAAVNFGAAMIALSAIGRTIEAQFDVLEAAYQAQREIDRAERQREEDAKLAAIAADPAFGIAAALSAIESAIRTVKAVPENKAHAVEIAGLPRGQKPNGHNTCTVRIARAAWSSKVVVQWNGRTMAKADAAAQLAALSAASIDVGIRVA